ncbi:MAG: molybdopterin converting factor subunit 1 [Hyphomicrobium sp.]
MTIRYFAWVREKVGRGEERVTLPASILTIADLIAWMQTRGPEYAAAFAKPEVIRAALDHKHVKPDTPIGNAREIGFFPPVTGG